MAHDTRCESSTIARLKTVVEGFAVNMSEDEVRKMTIAELCRESFRERFEHLLNKKHKNPSIISCYPLIVLSY